jgi:hypothetical protein
MASMLEIFKTEILPKLEQGSSREIDPALVKDLKEWSDPPKALEVMYSLDINAYGSLSSGFVTRVLETVLKASLESEGKTYEDVAKEAQELWRNDPDYASKPRPTFKG